MTATAYDIVWGQNDTVDSPTFTLYQANGAVFDLTGCAVTFVMTHEVNDSYKVSGAATIVSPTAGTVKYTPTSSADTNTVGNYLAQWVVTLPSGKVVTVPNDDDQKIRVRVGRTLG